MGEHGRGSVRWIRRVSGCGRPPLSATFDRHTEELQGDAEELVARHGPRQDAPFEERSHGHGQDESVWVAQPLAHPALPQPDLEQLGRLGHPVCRPRTWKHAEIQVVWLDGANQTGTENTYDGQGVMTRWSSSTWALSAPSCRIVWLYSGVAVAVDARTRAIRRGQRAGWLRIEGPRET